MYGTYNIGGREYPIIDMVENPDTGIEDIPLVDIPMMSDQRWMELCEESRRKHPELYEQYETELRKEGGAAV